MINNKMRPIHPGEILREEYLLPLGMSVNALSIALRISAPRINEVVRGHRGIFFSQWPSGFALTKRRCHRE